MVIPFTCGWIDERCRKYVKNLKSFKNKNYKSVRNRIQSLCKFGPFKLSINNVLVLKNYYSKHSLIISVRPMFGRKKIVYVLRDYRKSRCSMEVLYVPKSYNEFTEFNCKRKDNCNDLH